jgi:O-antigen/teichoic acid export membrane protein
MAIATHTAIGWAIATRWADRAIGLVSISILARLLTPQDFGLVALATLTQLAIGVLFTFGLDWALVQHRNPTREHYNTAWSLRLLSGLGCAVLLCAAAPVVAWFFKEPRVLPLVITLSGAVVLWSLQNPYMAELRRQMNFRNETLVIVLAKLFGMVTAVSVAYFYRSYWALPLGVLANAGMETGASYLVHRGRPAWCLSASRSLLKFSVWMLLSGIVTFVRERLANIAVGRELGNSSLGFFTLSQEVSRLASTDLVSPLNRAVFSKQSRLADSPDELTNSFLLAVYSIWLLAIPATVGVALVAPELVRVLLGSQWLDMVAVLQLLCLANAISLLEANSPGVFIAVNRGSYSVAVASVSTLVLLAALVAFVPAFGLLGAAWAQVAGAAAAVPATFWLLRRIVRLRWADLLAGLWRPVSGCAIMAACVRSVRPVVQAETSQPLLALAICVCAGALSYIAAVGLFWLMAGKPRGSEQVLLDIVRDRLGAKSVR